MTRNELQERGNATLALITAIRQKSRERDRLLATLEMQALLMLQGIDPNDVEAYGYDEKLDRRPLPRLLAFHNNIDRRIRAWRGAAPVYNYVCLKSGERVTIEPLAVPPGEPADDNTDTTAARPL